MLKSEADVREEIIAPVLRNLGYKTGTDNNIIRENTIRIRYPHMFLGRKRPGKDFELTGRPDYVCEVRGVTRWVIEAKPPGIEISIDDIEQAHSYTMHPEIAAPIFVLCNGSDWKVFETNRGPVSDPVLHFDSDLLRDKFYIISNLLSPTALSKRYPVRIMDIGVPLSGNIGSSAKILSGFSRIESVEAVVEGLPAGLAIPELEELKNFSGFQTAISKGLLYRSNEYGIVADLEMTYSHASLEKFAELLGAKTHRYVSRDEFISQDPLNPTILEFTHRTEIPAGSEGFDFLKFSKVTIPISFDYTWFVEASGFIKENVFSGNYFVRMNLSPCSEYLKFGIVIISRGIFEINLDI